MNIEFVIFGRNENEQLGLNVRTSKCLPTKLNFKNTVNYDYLEQEGIKVVKMGGNRLAFITYENNLIITLNDYRNNNPSTYNACKICAEPKGSDSKKPIPHTHFENISNDIYILKKNVIDVAIGFSHCVFLTKNENMLYGFGTNGNCRLGVSHEAVNMEDMVSRMFSQFYNVKCYRIEVEHHLDQYEKIVSVHCLGQGTICKTNFNNLIVFGWSYRGELSTKSDKQVPRKETFFSERNLTIEKIFTGYSHVYYLVKTMEMETKLFVCGWNEDNQLGLTHTNNIFTITENKLPFVPDIKDIALGYDFSLILTKDGTVYVFGTRFLLPETDVEKLSNYPNAKKIKLENVSRISAGYYHCILVIDDKKFYPLGVNDCAQCGFNDDDMIPRSPGVNRELVIEHTANLSLVAAGQYSTAIIFSNHYTKLEAEKRLKSLLFKSLQSSSLSDVVFEYDFP
ncbi:ATS1 domain-containing protein [Naegleria gruberi]|uniref:ATS1 domain-containing protein n=1 Tax=Naegleria gruberi TaxID=5762 RepID=D2VTF4_NAEGR|nr:ATS1 domain-containing protein [Naegleria gruberi]EFC39922.1 ATS1 domain-containing protein [Naegleria gruberi]|eukprot:XP_002672666.1 ATS1 domain-containing protein [Naegleria gruberi strain NEG-M]